MAQGRQDELRRAAVDSLGQKAQTSRQQPAAAAPTTGHVSRCTILSLSSCTLLEQVTEQVPALLQTHMGSTRLANRALLTCCCLHTVCCALTTVMRVCRSTSGKRPPMLQPGRRSRHARFRSLLRTGVYVAEPETLTTRGAADSPGRPGRLGRCDLRLHEDLRRQEEGGARRGGCHPCASSCTRQALMQCCSRALHGQLC